MESHAMSFEKLGSAGISLSTQKITSVSVFSYDLMKTAGLNMHSTIKT